MSGFVGLVSSVAAPPADRLVSHLTELMSRDCPDGTGTWVGDGAALGHALLVTTRDSLGEKQPLSLGADVHIVGDVRLDRRDDLIGLLDDCRPGAPDIELVLRAYLRWGGDCVDHISGDFAFAIWNGAERRLFCARDHFGVVPLYYGRTDDGLVVATHIQCPLVHPDIAEDLDEAALGDFLLLGMNMNLATTVYAAVQKVPPAHALTWTGGNLTLRRYWSHTCDVEPLRFHRKRDYVDRFLDLLNNAVADRLRTDSAATHLSGGLDSTSIAAIAATRLGDRGVAALQAYNITYRDLLEEDEGRLAQIVADRIGTPLEVLYAEDFIGTPPPDAPSRMYPEPHVIREQVAEIEISRRVSEGSRVLLAGFGGDPALYPPAAAFRDMIGGGNVIGALAGIASIYQATGRVPRFGLRTRLGLRQARKAPLPSLPEWVDPEFAARTGMAERMADLMARAPQKDRTGMAEQPLWSNIFAWSHPGFSGQAVKTRFPFFDLRLVEFLQRVPPIPWLYDKVLLREAMRGILPEQVRVRPKSPLPGSGHYNLVKRQGAPGWTLDLAQSDVLGGLVDRGRLFEVLSDHDALTPTSHRQIETVIHLAFWLVNRQRAAGFAAMPGGIHHPGQFGPF